MRPALEPLGDVVVSDFILRDDLPRVAVDPATPEQLQSAVAYWGGYLLTPDANGHLFRIKHQGPFSSIIGESGDLTFANVVWKDGCPLSGHTFRLGSCTEAA